MLNLDFRKIRKAFDARQLPGRCSYTGPCAVGVCFEPEERELIPNHSIAALFDAGHVSAPVNQMGDWAELQRLHDLVWTKQFSELLTELEKKYAPH
jgi:hypothetical protein